MRTDPSYLSEVVHPVLVLVESIRQGRNTHVEFELKLWEIKELLLCLSGLT